MHHLVLRVLKRFYGPKLALKRSTNLKLERIGLLALRNRKRVAISEKDKLSNATLIYNKMDNLLWLHNVTPGFAVDGSKIRIIYEPKDFYFTLVQKCKNAKKRITFASLYLGTGQMESELVKVIKESIHNSKGGVKVIFLLDYMRGSRGQQNSRKMLEPLLAGKHGDSCQIFLYHTPKLRGLLKKLIPDRFNEVIGLQHMKLYMIDNDLIISGANLSNDYFTNRQDRYFVIEDCKELCDFYNELVSRVGKFSFLLKADGTTILSSEINPHPFMGPRKEFIDRAAQSVQTLFQKKLEKQTELNKKKLADADTWIFPLVQMGQLNINHDSQVTLKLLQSAPPGTILRLATGYFNLTSEYTSAVLKQCRAICHLLTAHPTANGFFNATGVASRIPTAYTKIEESFFKLCNKLGQQKRVFLWEYVKPGWTYHAKGLWYSLPDQQKPSLTLIGSPNFGYRSVNRDLETQIAIVTRNETLQNALEEEHKRLFSCAHHVTSKTFSQHNRSSPTWVSAAVILFRYYF
ncbi:hypothetical protein KM043_011376 [Ampulex compressa]|nr:hypothetical protein KM043_011376 [Ampulex compressa]